MEESKEEQEQNQGQKAEEKTEIKEERKPIKIAEPIKRQEQKPRVPIDIKSAIRNF